MIRSALLVAVAVLVSAGGAQACACAGLPLAKRLDDADAAVVGRVVGERAGQVRGAPERVLTFEVDQWVKGDVENRLVIRSPLHSDCDLVIRRDATVGLLLTQGRGGAWLGTACSVVDPGLLVAAGGSHEAR